MLLVTIKVFQVENVSHLSGEFVGLNLVSKFLLYVTEWVKRGSSFKGAIFNLAINVFISM